MRILSTEFVEYYQGRLLNIHPSLLPAYKGLDTHARVLAAQETYHGTTVHFVIPDLDAGPAIAQAQFKRQPDDTVESLTDFTKNCEYSLYPQCIHWLCTGVVQLIDQQVVIANKQLEKPICWSFDRQ